MFLVQKIGKEIQDRRMAPIEVQDLARKSYWRLVEFRNAKAKGKIVLSTGLMALALATSASEHSYQFWHGVATDDGLRIGDPRKTFLNFLRDNKESAQHRMPGKPYIEVLFYVGAYCFNCFVQQKQIKIINYAAVQKTDRVMSTEFEDGITADSLHTFFSKKEN